MSYQNPHLISFLAILPLLLELEPLANEEQVPKRLEYNLSLCLLIQVRHRTSRCLEVQNSLQTSKFEMHDAVNATQ